MKISRRTLLATAAMVPIVSQAKALSLGSGNRIFNEAVRQIGGVVDIPDHMIRAVEKEFLLTFGSEAMNRFITAMDGKSAPMVVDKGSDEIRQQAKLIATVLYTGEIVRNNVTKVAYYPWSLAWSSLAFTKAPGLCGGPAFGHWEHAP